MQRSYWNLGFRDRAFSGLSLSRISVWDRADYYYIPIFARAVCYNSGSVFSYKFISKKLLWTKYFLTVLQSLFISTWTDGILHWNIVCNESLDITYGRYVLSCRQQTKLRRPFDLSKRWLDSFLGGADKVFGTRKVFESVYVLQIKLN